MKAAFQFLLFTLLVSLLEFQCHKTQPEELVDIPDVSNNNSLTGLITCGNKLTTLDISMNTALVKIGINNMPTLFEVCVWTAPFPPPGVVVLSEFSPKAYFTAEC